MNVVVIFDIDKNEAAAKQALSAKGYHDKWISNGQTYFLPNSCMWKPKTTIAEVKVEVEEIIANTGATAQRLLVLPASPWEAITGSHHSPHEPI